MKRLLIILFFIQEKFEYSIKKSSKVSGFVDMLPGLTVLAMFFIVMGVAINYFDSPGPKFWQNNPIIIIDNSTSANLTITGKMDIVKDGEIERTEDVSKTFRGDFGGSIGIV